MVKKVYGRCMGKGPNMGKDLEMVTYEVVMIEATGRYQAQGENPECKSKLVRFIPKEDALQWERDSGMKMRVHKDTPEKKRAREEKARKKRERREKRKQKEKEKKRRERERAKKAKKANK